MYNRSGHLQPCHKNKSFGWRSQEKPDCQDPDITLRRPPTSRTNRSNAPSSSMSLPVVNKRFPSPDRRCLQLRATGADTKGRLAIGGKPENARQWQSTTTSQTSIEPMLDLAALSCFYLKSRLFPSRPSRTPTTSARASPHPDARLRGECDYPGNNIARQR